MIDAVSYHCVDIKNPSVFQHLTALSFSVVKCHLLRGSESEWLSKWWRKCWYFFLWKHEDFFYFLPVEKSVSEVLDNSVNLWEEGRVEDELSPEEIQMVWNLTHHYSLFMSYSICRSVRFICVSWIHRYVSECTVLLITFMEYGGFQGEWKLWKFELFLITKLTQLVKYSLKQTLNVAHVSFLLEWPLWRFVV